MWICAKTEKVGDIASKIPLSSQMPGVSTYSLVIPALFLTSVTATGTAEQFIKDQLNSMSGSEMFLSSLLALPKFIRNFNWLKRLKKHG